MPPSGTIISVSRKLAVLAVSLLVLTACGNPTAGLKLTIATGFGTGVYFSLGSALADAWTEQTGIDKPRVLQTNGSEDNLNRLRAGEANVAISAADVATDHLKDDGRHKPRALARIYDDYLHVVVRDESDIRSVKELRGKRVAVGALNSGVQVIADRVLKIAGVTVDAQTMSLPESSKALLDGRIDAFFWSGGLPTREILDLSTKLAVRLVDMSDVMKSIRELFPYYNSATVPLATYAKMANTTPVTTLIVPNLLLVTDEMSKDAARVLTAGVFEARSKLIAANAAANSIDMRSAIETRPVPLHDGAVQYYRDFKDNAA
jgi:TRAP transporter TAXI family solute receptor